MKETVQGLKLLPNFRIKHFPKDLYSNFRSCQGFFFLLPTKNLWKCLFAVNTALLGHRKVGIAGTDVFYSSSTGSSQAGVPISPQGCILCVHIKYQTAVFYVPIKL